MIKQAVLPPLKELCLSLLLGHTTKGKGVSFMENQAGWHGSAINDEQYAAAMKELKERYAQAEKGCAAE